MMQILVPVDFEPQSLIALEQSYNLARLLPAEIVLLYVYDPPAGIRSLFGASYDDEMLKKLEEKLLDLASRVREETGLAVSTLLETGRIYSRIVETAEKTGARFIIMGTHSQPGLPGETAGVMGANSSRVLRSAKCPVITINAKHHYNGCRNILLPLDLTMESRQKVTWGIRMAKIYGAGIKVVSGIWSMNDPAVRNRLNLLAAQVKQVIEKEGIRCTADLIENVENEKALIPAVLNYAEQQGDIDLVMIMTQQEAGVVEFFMGSRAQEFVRLSPIPVMSITPKELGFVSIFS
ncbi:MAG TPA: universal stress protein [Bacteroidales bacterium]|nr:universal stress protein [Bacteroidales bacterium]HPS63528.1 universal stress protein [Bacteroidales bacterium]